MAAQLLHPCLEVALAAPKQLVRVGVEGGEGRRRARERGLDLVGRRGVALRVAASTGGATGDQRRANQRNQEEPHAKKGRTAARVTIRTRPMTVLGALIVI